MISACSGTCALTRSQIAAPHRQPHSQPTTPVRAVRRCGIYATGYRMRAAQQGCPARAVASSTGGAEQVREGRGVGEGVHLPPAHGSAAPPVTPHRHPPLNTRHAYTVCTVAERGWSAAPPCRRCGSPYRGRACAPQSDKAVGTGRQCAVGVVAQCAVGGWRREERL